MYIDPQGRLLCECPLYSHDHEEIDASHLRGASGAICYPTPFGRTRSVGKRPDVVLSYRQHLASMCHANPGQMRDEMEACVAEAKSRRGLTGGSQLIPHPRTRLSPFQQEIKWAWWALGSGCHRTARKHAWQGWLRGPLNKAALKCLVWTHVTPLKRKVLGTDQEASAGDVSRSKGLGDGKACM